MLVVCVLGAMAYVTYDAFLIEKPLPIAKVQNYKGVISVRRGADALDIEKDMLLEAGDQLVTTKNGHMQIVFSDGSVLLMGAATSIGLDEYAYNEKSNFVNAKIQFVKGAIRAVTGRVNLVRNIQVSDARGTTIGIRGTDIFIGNIEKNVIDVLLIESKKSVAVSNKKGKVKLTTGLGTRVAVGEAPSAVKVWPEAKIEKALALVATQ